MKNILFLLVLFGHLSFADNPTFYDEADVFFSQYVKNGLVDYAAIKNNPENLSGLMKTISDYEYTTRPEEEQIAFLINVYNIAVIKGIIDAYPVKGPMQISNFFDEAKYDINGQKVSLNTIEKSIFFPLSGDERLHFVLVCAAVSCPKLANFAYRAKTLESQIIQTTRSVLNDEDFLYWDDKRLYVSQIFNWYKEDFQKKADDPQSYISRYLIMPPTDRLKVKYYPYDWTLNDQNL